MLEFYQGYADYHDLIQLTEEMFKKLGIEIVYLDGSLEEYKNQ